MAQIKRRPPTSTASLQTSLALINDSVFVGFVVDPAEPTQRFTVELSLDSLVIEAAYADQYSQEAAEKFASDGCHGFAISVPRSAIDNAVIAEARVANLGLAVGAPLLLSELRKAQKDTVSTSRLRWLGGLRFSGWVADDNGTIAALKVMVDGEQIMQVRALGWAQADDDVDQGRPARAFDFHLPERFADGCVRRVSVLRDSGDPLLPDGPLPFVAFPDGLASTLASFGNLESERLRGELYDHLVPMSLPMSTYQQWQERFPVPFGPASSKHCAVVLIGAGPVETTLDSLELQTHTDWAAGVMEEEGEPTAFKVGPVRTFLAEDAADSDFVVFALAGTVFPPTALQRIVQAFTDFNDAVAVYGDVNILGADGGLWPLAFSAFDYERLLEQGYCAHLFALRRDIAQTAISALPSNMYRLFNTMFDKGFTNAIEVIHLPGAIGTLPAFDRSAASAALHEATAQHLKRRKIDAQVSSLSAGVLPAIRVQREPAKGKTTIIIPTRDRVTLLRDCLQSIKPGVEKAGADIIVVDNESTDRATLDFLKGLDNVTTKVIRVAGPFNFARLNNIAARQTQSEYLCLLNNNIKALDEDWLEELQTRIAEPDVGAVGALLLWPSGMVQHGGVILGPNFSAIHAFNDRTADDPGYADLLRVAHECSAVTAACMLTRRSDYLKVGGMDEVRLAVTFNDVDYCLRLREAGRRIIITPHAKLTHLESASRGREILPDRAARFGRELQVLRSRWGDQLVHDPYYNPTLSLDSVPFSALAWPPRAMNARVQKPTIAREIPSGF
jgi:GT2 family glycosyltransferase